MERRGLAAVFVLLTLKSAGLPLPPPADLLMVVAGSQASRGVVVLWEITAALVLALVFGGTFEFLVARGPGRSTVYRLGHYAGLTPERLDHAAEVLRRGGLIAIVLSLLTPGVNVVTNPACGLARVPVRVFFPALVLGSVVEVGLHLIVGYAGLAVFDFVPVATRQHVGWLLIAAALLGGLAVWLVVHRHHAQRGHWHLTLGSALHAWHRTGLPVLYILHWLHRAADRLASGRLLIRPQPAGPAEVRLTR